LEICRARRLDVVSSNLESIFGFLGTVVGVSYGGMVAFKMVEAHRCRATCWRGSLATPRPREETPATARRKPRERSKSAREGKKSPGNSVGPQFSFLPSE